ncbi:hypothetical protein [Saccharopolyspora hordei]|uniref:Uncharacterized protein n=1 Tax=Saccharopolyspora hordei TaxID=1838 RepID=A0A853AMQ1_9PSEU|nr:hypothetical protein [Saccharopolyspora hordei]NYI83553.1 hypothetical protein [Saccharopolyspora hordei]
MSSPHHEPDGGFGERGPMFWLPPGGFSNGLEATNWAELADLGEGQLADVLFTLADAGIAGYVAHPTGGRTTKYRLWVDTLQYRRAEDVLMDVFRAHDHRNG